MTFKMFPVNEQGQIGEAFINKFSTFIMNDPMSLVIEGNQSLDAPSLLSFIGTELGIQSQLSLQNNLSEDFQEKIVIEELDYLFDEQFKLVPVTVNEAQKEETSSTLEDSFTFEQISLTENLNLQQKQTKDIEEYVNYGYGSQEAYQ